MPHFFMRAMLAGLALTIGNLASAHSADTMPAMHHHDASPAAQCASLALDCATVATPFLDAHGRLWVVWSADGAVSVSASNDAGKHFDAPVVIGRYGARLDTGAESHPQIAVDGKGRIVVAYSVFKDDNWNAEVLVSRSGDGKTFSPPHAISSDAASQRFPVIAFGAHDTLFAAWLDKRTVAAAHEHGMQQAGAALAYAWSDDAGATFKGEAIAEDHTCECCRVDLALDGKQNPAVLFRKIYGTNERDHAVLAFNDQHVPTSSHRVAIDHWAIDGCPHHGPALAVSSDGTWHAAWFTAGEAREGLYYARSTDQGQSFSVPQSVGEAAYQPGRPSLLAREKSVWLAWKEFDGEHILARVRHSSDGGLTWSADRTIGTAEGQTDRPMLVADSQHVYLSWLSQEHGYQLIVLDAS
ncbi:sialidase family protein [Paraburkholderia dinghuensis]|uniref:Exo-alpha-sialidase n=1 Tax=Paraburkholderia dinghuensis TaxID=2305225 RepID=A0A3N6N3I1_9BURK|nr:sialidase family protein [Paraburkholderia dinghuensis]RQH09115.1 exo-alpha-sialidase [Paraburkholderia dinghuensis]